MRGSVISDICFMFAMGLTPSVFALALALALRDWLPSGLVRLPPVAAFALFVIVHDTVTVVMVGEMGSGLAVGLWALLLGAAVVFWLPVVRPERGLSAAGRALYLFVACPVLDLSAMYGISNGGPAGGLAMIVGMTPLGLIAAWSLWEWGQLEEKAGGRIGPEGPVDSTFFAAPAAPALSPQRAAQVLLGVLWLLDGMLQLQPGMFGPSMFRDMLLSGPPPPPGWLLPVERPLAALLGHHTLLFNGAFAALQLALGLGLLWAPTVRWALVGSVGWALSVWLLGEAAGGLFGPAPSALGGAPGAALVYLLVAVVIWPGAPVTSRRVWPRRAPPSYVGPALWSALWVGTAFFELQARASAGQLLSVQIKSASAGGPGWLVRLSADAAQLAHGHGGAAALSMGLAQVVIGAGIWWPPARRAVLVAGLVVGCAYGLVGQGLGGVFTGGATDPGTGPALAIFAVGLWPGRSAHLQAQGSAATVVNGLPSMSIESFPGQRAPYRPGLARN